MPDLSHEARHRAGRPASSKQGRVIAGLALPTAATLALVFCATAAAVATSAKTHNRVFVQSAAAMAPPQSASTEAAERARQAQADAVHLAEVENNQALLRTAEVARGLQRKKLAAAAIVAKRAALAHSWRMPITNPITTSGFGYRWGSLHAGEDFAVSVGTPLASMSTGTVIYAGQESGYGDLVEIRYWDGTISYFGHMSVIAVTVGESVDPGHIVGQSGNTGDSTGPHLHLEIHPNGGVAVDPLPWLAAHHIFG